MSDSQVVSIQAFREVKKAESDDPGYRARILLLEKHELLEEMIRFQEERTQVGRLTVDMMVRGRILFTALEDSAETEELRILTRSYKRHLDFELASFKNKPTRKSSS